ncbi:hypothetical protein D3C72_378230 [compost metagenome]
MVLFRHEIPTVSHVHQASGRAGLFHQSLDVSARAAVKVAAVTAFRMGAVLFKVVVVHLLTVRNDVLSRPRFGQLEVVFEERQVLDQHNGRVERTTTVRVFVAIFRTRDQWHKLSGVSTSLNEVTEGQEVTLELLSG